MSSSYPKSHGRQTKKSRSTVKTNKNNMPSKDEVIDALQSSTATDTLPSNQSMTSALSAAQSSDILETIKETPLSETGRKVVTGAERLLDATERLLSDKNQDDEMQKILIEGSLAASKLRESAHVHQGIASTFGDAGVKAEATTQDLMHRMFDVIKLMVSAHEFRILLRDLAGLALDWLENISVATIHEMKGQTASLDSDDEGNDHLQVSEEKWTKADKQQHKLRTEGKERLLHAFFDITSRLQDHPAWKHGVQSVLDIFDAVRDQVSQSLDEKPSIASSVSDDVRQHAEAAVSHAVRLIENFGGNLEPLQLAVDEVNDALNHQGPAVDGILKRFRSLLENPDDKQLTHDTYMDIVALFQGSGLGDIRQGVFGGDDQVSDKSEHEDDAEIKERTDSPTKSGEEIRTALMHLAAAGQEFVESMRSDPDIQDVSQSMDDLTLALFVDEKTGQVKFKPELLADLQRIVPAILQRLASFPIAKIDISTEDVDVILDNISLRTKILPKDIAILTETHMTPDVATAKGGGVDAISTAVTNQIEIKLRNVQVKAPDLVFYYYSRPFPSFADVGIADVNVIGQGLDIDLVLIPAPSTSSLGQIPGSPSLLRVAAVDAKVHEIDFNVKRARHNWMYSLARPLVKRIISRQLEKAIEEGLESTVNSLDQTAAQAIKTAKDVLPNVDSKIESSQSNIRAMVTEE